MGKLTEKTALVTGAGRGIGRAYALRLAELGANVGVIDIDLHSYKSIEGEGALLTADTVVDELRTLGVKATGVEADISNKDEVFSAVKKVAEALGDISILVCNAGGGSGTLTENKASEMDFGEFDKIMRRNLNGTIYTVNAAAPMMKKNRYGKIITVSSLNGICATANGGYAHYGTAKAAIIHYTKYLAQDLGEYGVTANCIAPGYIATARLIEVRRMDGDDKYLKGLALKRYGTPEDCANVIEFLSTDLSDYVSGTVIEVSAGASDRLMIP